MFAWIKKLLAPEAPLTVEDAKQITAANFERVKLRDELEHARTLKKNVARVEGRIRYHAKENYGRAIISNILCRSEVAQIFRKRGFQVECFSPEGDAYYGSLIIAW